MHAPVSLLERLDREQPDCVLLDLWLGSTCALDLLPAIERQPAYVPVVFLSAQADVADSVLAMKHGAIDFLTKPVEPGPLLDAVIRAVARARTVARGGGHSLRGGRSAGVAHPARARGVRPGGARQGPTSASRWSSGRARRR
jgi:DNA-binding NtrC family response regulator